MKISVILTIAIVGNRTRTVWTKMIEIPFIPIPKMSLHLDGVGILAVDRVEWVEKSGRIHVVCDPHYSTKTTTREQVQQHMKSHGWGLVKIEDREESAP